MELFPERKYSKAQVKALIRDGKTMQRVRTEDPAEYRLIRALAVQDGLLDAPGYFVRETDLPKAARPAGEYTQAEIDAMQQFSEADCIRLFKPDPRYPQKDNGGTLAKENPQAYEIARVSARARGILPEARTAKPATVKPATPTKSDEPSTFALADDIAARAFLPTGTKVTMLQFQQILKNIQEHEQRTAAAAEAEAAVVKG
jgi:hypothetical protein